MKKPQGSASSCLWDIQNVGSHDSPACALRLPEGIVPPENLKSPSSPDRSPTQGRNVRVFNGLSEGMSSLEVASAFKVALMLIVVV